MTLMHAEILWLDPADMERGSAVLAEQGFQIEVLDLVDPFGPTVWITAKIDSGLTDIAFLHWVASIVEATGGDVIEAGYARPPALAY